MIMKLKVIGYCTVALILLIVGYQKYSEYQSLRLINNYDECVAAKGSVIQESFPSTCITNIGTHFTEQLTIKNVTNRWNIYHNRDRYFSFEYPEEWKYENGGIFNSNKTFHKQLSFMESDFDYWLSINYLNTGYINHITSTTHDKFGNNTVETTIICNRSEFYMKGTTVKPGSECVTISHLDYKDIGFISVDLNLDPKFVEEERIYREILSTFKFIDSESTL